MLLLLIACLDVKEESNQANNLDTASQTPQDTAPPIDTAVLDTATIDTAEPEVPELDCHEVSAIVTWETERVTLSLVGSQESASYYFGVAQTYRSEGLQWTGEDCFLGFLTQTGEEYSYCHPAGMGSNAGVSLEYGAPFAEVQEGVNTHFTSLEFATQVSYILKDAISGCCWIWGQDPSYFTQLQCLPLPE